MITSLISPLAVQVICREEPTDQLSPPLGAVRIISEPSTVKVMGIIRGELVAEGEGLISLRSIHARMARYRERVVILPLGGRQLRSNPARCAGFSAPFLNAISPTQTSWAGEMADGEGFEPSERLLAHTLSRRAHSTTLASILLGSRFSLN